MIKQLSREYDGLAIQLTPEFIAAIESLIRAQILMMRAHQPQFADSWYYGCAKIVDLDSSDWLELTYGSYEDIEWTATKADVFVIVPL